ncbi:MAG: hypothetical protein D6784_18570 [Chloroflexi bacterium]|nr:MAG: hypothetical protein D6784_18570 [Chloroflexota bacterium]
MNAREQIFGAVARVAAWVDETLARSGRQGTALEDDELRAEINRLKQELSRRPTRPVRVQTPRPPEALSEQEKIMDLAG